MNQIKGKNWWPLLFGVLITLAGLFSLQYNPWCWVIVAIGVVVILMMLFKKSDRETLRNP